MRLFPRPGSRLAAILACSALAMAASHAQTPTPQAPPAMSPPSTPTASLRLPEMSLHDPWILAYAPSKTYYLYTSNVARLTGVRRAGTMAYRSQDLQHWEPPVVVFTVPDGTWADPAVGAWAPEVHEYRGRYYLLTTLHNPARTIAQPPAVPRRTHLRGTVIAVGDSPAGPFKLLREDGPVPPADSMTLDGTLYVDPDQRPWMVYAHEWVQQTDGTMEAVPLKPDLSATDGPPVTLFKASEAPWLDVDTKAAASQTYTTDGPELFRTRDDHLLMLWASYDHGSYVQTVARSRSGELVGPWEQLDPLVRQDSGHGMLFHTFDGQLMMVLHRPFKIARGKLYEMEDAGDHLRVLRERTDLDGDTP